MINRLPILLFSLLIIGCGATRNLPTAGETPVAVSMDLTSVSNDRVLVAVDPGAFTVGEVRFYIPKTVPGTYSEDNYGRYVEDLAAYNYKGEPIPVIREDDNTWRIGLGAELDRITYYVNDSYDVESSGEEAPFSPAGTNILAGKNFMLNLHGFVGYFEGLKEQAYTLQLRIPEGLYPATSLEGVAGADGTMTYTAARYFEVIDNPIQLSGEAPVSFQVGDITVNISVYSPNGGYTASAIQPAMERMMQAQKAFLGDIDGTREYNILLYLSTLDQDAQGFGALEHHTSTVVVLPEQIPAPQLEEAMVDVVSHEFFHIVTPLNVHSEEIQYFDYNAPKMSQHLWMYEGTTEYFANLFQIRQGLISEEEFYQRIVAKIQNSGNYNDALSFTEMSRNVLEEPYAGEYPNVYEKGTLINMALDLRLLELSGGTYGVLQLMKDLSAKYDEDTPFKDDALFDEIVAMTYPKIREYFDTHVIGDTPIDYAAVLQSAGLNFGEQEVESGIFLKDMQGHMPYIDVDPGDNDIIYIRRGIPLNSFLTGLGAQGGDVLKSINGTEVDLNAIRMIIGQSLGWGPDTEVEMVVERDGEEITLEGKVGNPTVKEVKIIADPDASEAAVRLREAWLKG
ncbi:peptidase M61 [Robiginitalea sp. SC105]|uniref:M61 family metallopeptidase n=1 Tax=Robiginitalea sp. SC105 TaxID=2762332 RepID=UPI00163B37C2|nr:peptidase M61 [Robiginitalea sp. SC105]MBC2838732.1 peptidase M61 [Robiginitalea sp. SC105]